MKKIKLIFAVMMIICLCGCSAKTTNSVAVNEDSTSTKEDNVSSDQEKIELDINILDQIVIKEVRYNVDHNNCVRVELKITNISKIDYDDLSLQLYSYNKDGERIGASYTSVSDIEPDLTFWTHEFNTKLSMDELGSVGIASISLGKRQENNPDVSEGVFEEKLSSTIKITLDQMNKK